jgi:hypothetical protein
MLPYAQTVVYHIHQQVCQIFPLVDAFGPIKPFLGYEHLGMSRPIADAHSNCECRACAAKGTDHMVVNFQFLVAMQVERLAAIQQVFTGFMEEVISGMAGYIPLKAIGQRILAQYSRQQFGDFRGTLLGLLSAYNYESSILTTARCTSCTMCRNRPCWQLQSCTCRSWCCLNACLKALSDNA